MVRFISTSSSVLGGKVSGSSPGSFVIKTWQNCCWSISDFSWFSIRSDYHESFSYFHIFTNMFPKSFYLGSCHYSLDSISNSDKVVTIRSLVYSHCWLWRRFLSLINWRSWWLNWTPSLPPSLVRAGLVAGAVSSWTLASNRLYLWTCFLKRSQKWDLNSETDSLRQVVNIVP